MLVLDITYRRKMQVLRRLMKTLFFWKPRETQAHRRLMKTF
ncbi:hypothetical protein AVEN_15324-1, partial [Araneus ventricosus]